jgi:tetratricopeptide (TPR) repeat protein
MKHIVLAMIIACAQLIGHAQSLETGYSYIQYQKYNSAENFFHEFLKKEPGNEEAWLGLINSYLLQNKTGKAVDSLSAVPGEIQSSPFIAIARGTVSLALNNKDSAKIYFGNAMSAVKSKKSLLPAYVAQAQVYSGNGDIPYAVTLLTNTLKKNDKNPWLHSLLGKCYRRLHDGSKAFQAFTTATQEDKHYADAFYELGKIFQTQKNKEMYLEYFTKAIAADKDFAPAYYELYEHYLYTDPAKAMTIFNDYRRLADPDPKQDYANADLLYLTKQYPLAISRATELLKRDTVVPRLHKLVAYSYAESGDTANALAAMQKYFTVGDDSIFIAKDFETAARLFGAGSINRQDSAMTYLAKAAAITTDAAARFGYYRELANQAKRAQDYAMEAKWLGLYYQKNENAKNVDLFNWGIAAYRAGDYAMSDTVFAEYTEKYPDQTYGYYWRAKSNAAIDTTMEQGLAIPHYNQLIQMLNPDSLSATDKKWLTEAYSYLGAYETNTKKNYEQAIDYFEMILVVDPENQTAKKYIDILEETKSTAEASR